MSGTTNTVTLVDELLTRRSSDSVETLLNAMGKRRKVMFCQRLGVFDYGTFSSEAISIRFSTTPEEVDRVVILLADLLFAAFANIDSGSSLSREVAVMATACESINIEYFDQSEDFDKARRVDKAYIKRLKSKPDLMKADKAIRDLIGDPSGRSGRVPSGTRDKMAARMVEVLETALRETSSKTAAHRFSTYLQVMMDHASMGRAQLTQMVINWPGLICMDAYFTGWAERIMTEFALRKQAMATKAMAVCPLCQQNATVGIKVIRCVCGLSVRETDTESALSRWMKLKVPSSAA